jgi:hypothetical protein
VFSITSDCEVNLIGKQSRGLQIHAPAIRRKMETRKNKVAIEPRMKRFAGRYRLVFCNNFSELADEWVMSGFISPESETPVETCSSVCLILGSLEELEDLFRHMLDDTDLGQLLFARRREQDSVLPA